MFDLRPANAFERQFLYEQVKVLREVNETPRPVGYWQDFVDHLIPQVGSLASELTLPETAFQDPPMARAIVAGFVAASYPGAKKFLIEQCGLSREQVEAYPTAQTVFLAVVRFYDQSRDDVFKWNYLPFWQAESNLKGSRLAESLQARSAEVGWCTVPTNLLLPAVIAAQAAAARSQQSIALVQTVEAIRMYGAVHEGKLPPTLDELPVPAPVEPFTGKPLDYEYHGDRAVLNGHQTPGMRYRLVLRFAQEATP
jgi:hypothetical protein